MSTLVDIEFDLYYGTDTIRRVDMDSLEFESENKAHAVLYQATKTRPLRKLMRKLSVPKNGAFVDLGSGKGRALLVAMQLGFDKVIGVEFSPELCAVARKNIEIFSSRLNSHSQVEIVESDVSKYQFNPHSNVFFMYNPFDKVVVDRMIENLRNSLLQSPRQIWLIYNTPVWAELLDNAGLFFHHQDFEIGGTKFRVYNN